LIDIYALTHCITVETENIRRIWKRENRIIGDFNAFVNRKDELCHSYEKLRRVSAKPEFYALYNYLTSFLTPFIDSQISPLVWNKGKNAWASEDSEEKCQ